MAKLSDSASRPPEPDFDALPTWGALADQIESEIDARPEFSRYDGPSLAVLIREDRNSR